MNKCQPFSLALRHVAFKAILCILCLGNLCIKASAQACDTTFIKRIGSNNISEKAFKILQAPDGNLLIGGNKQNASLLMMVTPDGEILWERIFVLTTGDDFIYDMMIDSEGKIVAVGRDQLNSNTANYILRYDYVNNTVLWVRKMNDPTYIRLEGALELPNQNFFVYGTVQHSGSLDNLAIEIGRNDGSLVWMKSFNNGSTDVFFDAILVNNACYTANVQRYSPNFDKMRASISKLDLTGNQLWTRNYIKNQTSVARTYASSIKAVNDTLIVFGHGNLTNVSDYDYTLQLFATNFDGSILWAKNYNLPGLYQNSGTVTPLPDGYLLQGVFTQAYRTELFLIKVNKQGNVIWAKTIGGPENEWGRSVLVQDGHIYLVGHTDGLDASYDIILGKMSMSGDVVGPGCSFVADVTVTSNVLTNAYDGQHNMGNATGNHPLVSVSATPVAVASPSVDMVGCGCTQPLGCNNLLLNASFENNLTAWSVTGDVTITNEANSGAKAVKICSTSPGSIGQLFPAQAGESFTASLWAKSENGPNNANVQLRFMNSSFTPLTTGSDQQFIYSGFYEPYQLNAIAPPGTAYVHLLVWKSGSACAYVDDMELCKDGAPVLLPDLAVTGVAVTNAPVLQGSQLAVEYTLSNLGTSAVSGSYTVKLYLSSTNSIQNGIPIGTYNQQNTPVGFTANLTATPTVPLSLNPGNYYLIVVADADGAIVETSESNNTRATGSTFMVQQSSACAITANVTNIQCNNNGTLSNTADDLMSFTVLATATSSSSAGYQTFVQQTNQGYNAGQYGAPFTISNIPISTGNLTVKLTDNNSPACTTLVNVVAPPPCSSGLPDLSLSNVVIPTSAIVGSAQAFSFVLNHTGSTILTGSSGLNNHLYLSLDNQFDNTDLLLGGGSYAYNFQPNSQVQYGPLNFTIPTGIQAGNYFLLLVIDQGQIIAESNESNNTYSQLISIQNPPSNGNIDLSLTVTATATAPIYTSYPVAIKVTNSGSLAATGVKVVCQKPNGVVYTGGNEFTASQGSFGPLTNQVWNVGTLAPGATATLTVNYFLLQSNLPVVYAQVTAANETDPDSTPNNGTPPTPNEDDEASSAAAPPPPPPAQPDLTLSNLTAPTSISASTGNFTFTLQNIGTGAVQGSYQIGSYLSTDNVLSADDYAFASIAEQNTAIGSFHRTGSYSLPTGFATGNYYLIVKVDLDNTIAEGNENNNTASRPITVTGLVCSGDMILTSQADVDAFSGCNVIDGDLVIQPTIGITNSDVIDLSPLLSITQVNGTIVLAYNRILPNLHGLENITAANRLVVTNCDLLENLNELANLESELTDIFIMTNPALLNLDGLEGISAPNGYFIISDNNALQNINALANIDEAEKIEIYNNIALQNVQGLANLTNVQSRIVLSNCDALVNLDGLQNLTSVGGLIITSHELLQDVSALSNLANIGGDLILGFNPMLSDCCIFSDLLSSNAITGAISINNNAPGCNSQTDILDNCTPQGVDLQLVMTATNLTPSIYTAFPVQLTITNAGGQAATGVIVHFPRPAGVVYEGGNEFTVTKGAFNAFGNEQWFIGNLAPGETATITVRYFLLTSNALKPYAQVVACNEPDSDSQPNNGTAPTPAQDDEASVTVNGFAGGGSNALVRNGQNFRLNLFRIYPNPTIYQVGLELVSPMAQSATLDFYDQQGRLVYTMTTELEEGLNSLEAMVFDWKSGTYNIIARGEKTGLPAYGRFMKVWEE